MAYISNWTANEIAKASKYITDAMDELIVHTAKTSGMRADPSIVQAGKTAKSIYLADISVRGAGDYSPNKGWTENKATMTWTAYNLQYDRGTAFLIDALETQETGGLAAIGTVGQEFIRTQMVPEIDAVRIARAADKAVSSGYKTENETLTKNNIFSKIQEALDDLSDRTGSDTGNTIYINGALKKYLNGSSEVTRAKIINDASANTYTIIDEINGNPIVYVPSARMFSKVAMKTGENDTGGYTPGGSPVNFLICMPGAAQGVVSYQNTAIIPKGQHTEGDGDFFGYRIYHDLIVPKNKAVGLYVSLSSDHDGIQVNYDKNGGTGSIASSTYLVGETVTVKASTGLTPPATKTFSKWNTKADGSGIDYDPADTFTASADVTLYAQWSS